MSINTDFRSQDGRINLEQQRKRAKELLLNLKQGNAPDQLALLGTSGRPLAPTLSDAQWLIARQLGFSSWPKLKAHVDAVAFAAQHPDFHASDEPRTVHWRCGNDIAHSLKLAGFKGSFHMLSDPLCMGPVQDLPDAEFRAQRSDFISATFDMNRADVARRTDEEYGRLEQLGSDQHNVLWCEADAYDQLFLIKTLASLKRLPPRLELIEVDHVPGVQRFIGIGQLAPDVLAWLWPQRKPVTQAMLDCARKAWRAYCDASPVALATLAHDPQLPLRLLAPALLRQLQELPGSEDGLSLTERLSLQYLRETGPTTFGRVFAELMDKRDPLPFLGDMMFQALLRPLIDSKAPLLKETETHLKWPQRTLALTALGERVLEGGAYWLEHAQHLRWVGGVCIVPGRPHWTINLENRPVWRV
ncbi:DUF1835 domain-containing protein [Pseudomonas viridiflava]|uniref:DUF1835 domain-containing protein n=1 Tax=Pseudomonas viridiflava TaxID=33069 RepID=UPI000F02077A|nr:DUF1835 domain-containing protein [Pseudomonas viridiflava]